MALNETSGQALLGAGASGSASHAAWRSFFKRNRVPMQRGEVLHRDAAVWCALPCYVFQYLGHHRLCSVASWALWRFVFRCPVAVHSMSLSHDFPFWRKSVPNRLK